MPPSAGEIKVRVQEKTYNARRAFSSWQGFKDWVQVSDTALDQHSKDNDGSHHHQWSNVDLDPTPPEKRTWRWWNYVIFYWGVSFGNWTLGSTMVGIGLNWWQAIVVIFVSQFISSIAMFFNSRCASVYHIGYPIVGRSVFGIYGAYFFVLERAVLAIVWYGVQLYQGGALVSVVLRAIFGHNYTDIPNHIPASMGITSAEMLGFFLFWLIHLPFTFFRPYQLRGFFWFKAVVMIPAIFGLFIFCMVTTRGTIGLGHLTETSPGAGTGQGWFYIWAINSGMGNTATLITNQPDLARWSKTKTGAMWSQLVTNPIAVTLSASLGILSTAAINNAWGLTLWNQWDLLDAILTRDWSAGARTGVFFCAAGWCVSVLGTNIAGNMIPFGSDSTVLLPKYLTIPRGQFIVECLAFAICPWKILASASVFVTFLAGYGLFMASVVAIMIADYGLTRGNVFISHLYNGSPDNKHYYFHYGWNLQAVIAYIVGIALPFPGFVGTLGPHVSPAAEDLGHLGWLLSFFSTFIVYILLCMVWPTKNQRLVREMGLRFEEMSEREIVAEDGTVIEEGMEGYADVEGRVVARRVSEGKKWNGEVEEAEESRSREEIYYQ